MQTPFFKKHPKLTIISINLLLLLFIFILFEIVLRIFTPAWLTYTMKYLKTGNGFGHGSDANWQVKYKNNEFYSFMPNSIFKIYYPEYENTVHINSLGGRSTNVNEVTDTNNIIPFIGDSFVMGVGVEDTETVVALTKQKLNQNFLNLGITGSCISNQRNIIDNRYKELGQPPLVIYGFFLGNDFNDVIKEHQKKEYIQSLKNISEKDSNADIKKGFMWKLNTYISNNNFLNRLYTIQFIKQKIIDIRNKNKDKANRDGAFLIMNSADTNYINSAKLTIDNEIQLLSKEPYKSIVILIPDKHQLNLSLRKSMSQYYNIDNNNLKPFLPNQILIEALNKYKIRYIDPTQCLINKYLDGKLYYNMDNHMTTYGQKALADCIADDLKNYINKN